MKTIVTILGRQRGTKEIFKEYADEVLFLQGSQIQSLLLFFLKPFTSIIAVFWHLLYSQQKVFRNYFHPKFL